MTGAVEQLRAGRQAPESQARPAAPPLRKGDSPRPLGRKGNKRAHRLGLNATKSITYSQQALEFKDKETGEHFDVA